MVEAGGTWLRVFARPRTGVSRSQAKAALAVVWPRVAAARERAARQQDARLHTRRARRWNRLDRPSAAVSAPVDDPDGRRGRGAPHRVRQRGQPAPCAGGGETTRDGRSARPGRRKRPHHSPVADRERRCWPLTGGAVGVAFAWMGSRLLVNLLSTGRLDAIVLDLTPNWHVLGVHEPGGAGHEPALWVGAGVPRHDSGTGGGAQCRLPRDRRFAKAAGVGARHRASLAVAAAPGRRRAVRPDAPESANARPRLPPRRRAAGRCRRYAHVRAARPASHGASSGSSRPGGASAWCDEPRATRRSRP